VNLRLGDRKPHAGPFQNRRAVRSGLESVVSKGGDPRHGTKDDLRLVLIGVDVHAALFLEVNKPQPVVLFEVIKGWITGSTPELGEMHHVKK
jgi:hypothetical protein